MTKTTDKESHSRKLNVRRQKMDILKYLKAGGKLDASKAWRLFSCSKLATRCSEFLRDGIDIKKGWKSVTTKYGIVKVRTYRISKL